jgi:hypothetical protein
VRRRQCVISRAVAGSSAAGMFPLFITHDEYFVRCGGSGGGTRMFLICLATNFLVDGGSAAAARWRQRSSGGQRGGGVGSVVVAAERWQSGSGSAAMAAWRWWPYGGSAVVGSVAAVSASALAALRRAAWRQRCGSVVAAVLAPHRQRPAWRLQQKFGSIAASAVAAEWRELCCRHMPPRWQQRHRRQQRWRGHYQQSTIN